MKWLDDLVRKIAPNSIVEMGCGAGFLLRYIQSRYPHLRLQGIDSADNLIRIASELCGTPLIDGDYLEVQPDQKYDLVICDFGFDLVQFSETSTPHTTDSVGGFEFCPGCSDHLKLQFDSYLQAWRNWTHKTSCLAVAGRISHFGMLRAFVLSSRDVGWDLLLHDSAMLKIRHNGILERFPALVFTPLHSSAGDIDLAEIGDFYSNS